MHVQKILKSDNDLQLKMSGIMGDMVHIILPCLKTSTFYFFE